MGHYAEESWSTDNLMAGVNYDAEGLAVLDGEGALARGSVLGKVTKGAATASAVTGTGDGVIGAVTLLANAKVGTYAFRCVAAIENSGRFQVIDPDGLRLADLLVAEAYADQLSFTVADGANDFIVGDTFEVEVAAGSGKYVLADSTHVDGSQNGTRILGEAIDASDDDVETAGMFNCKVNRDALIFGGADTYADHEESLRAEGILLLEVVPAAE